MKLKYSVLQTINKASDSQLNPVEINSLADTAFRMAVNYLRLLHKRIHKLIIHEHLTIENIAIDAIASLFIKNENGVFNQITDLFKVWQPAIVTEDDAIYFFNKLVSKRVEQHISFLLRESDPFFSKILDSINYLIKKNGLKKIYYMGGIYIVGQDCESINGSVISHEDLDSIPAKYFLDKKNLVENILAYITKETNYFRAIPLNAFVFKIKALTFEMYKRDKSSDNFESSLDTDAIVKNALSKTYEKLETSYMNKGKLTNDEKLKFEKALEDMSKDLCDGGLNPGLYNYLSKHFNSLSNDEYKFKYHNMLEYLLKLLKENIAARL